MKKIINYSNEITADKQKIDLKINVPLWVTLPLLALTIYLIWRH